MYQIWIKCWNRFSDNYIWALIANKTYTNRIDAEKDAGVLIVRGFEVEVR